MPRQSSLTRWVAGDPFLALLDGSSVCSRYLDLALVESASGEACDGIALAPASASRCMTPFRVAARRSWWVR